MSNKIKIFYKLASPSPSFSDYTDSDLDSFIDSELDKENPNQDDIDLALEEINKRKEYEPAREVGNTMDNFLAFNSGLDDDIFQEGLKDFFNKIGFIPTSGGDNYGSLLGRGRYGVVIRGAYKGVDSALKISNYYQADEVKNVRKILDIKPSLSDETKSLIPEIYFCDYIDIAEERYNIIISEVLYKFKGLSVGEEYYFDVLLSAVRSIPIKLLKTMISLLKPDLFEAEVIHSYHIALSDRDPFSFYNSLFQFIEEDVSIYSNRDIIDEKGNIISPKDALKEINKDFKELYYRDKEYYESIITDLDPSKFSRTWSVNKMRNRGGDIETKIRNGCEELSFAGIIPDDVHLGNIMQDKDGNPKLIDFGFYRIRTSSSRLFNLYKISQDINKDWEEAAEEFGSEPVSEEEYLKSVAPEPEFGRQKYILEWLKSNGIQLISSGGFGVFSSGDYAEVFNGVCDGQDCVVKILTQREGSMDFDNWQAILNLESKMPYEVARHIPKIYKTIKLSGGRIRIPTYAIAMERLYPIHSDLKYLIADGWSNYYYSDKLLSNIYKPALEENIYNIMNDIYKSFKELISKNKLANLKSLIDEFYYSNANNIIPIDRLSYFISINIFKGKSKSYFRRLYDGIIAILKKHSEKIPYSSEFNNDNHDEIKLIKPFYNALKWLESNGISWGDLHDNNIMMDKEGTLKIMDIGSFKLKDKTSRISRIKYIYKKSL